MDNQPKNNAQPERILTVKELELLVRAIKVQTADRVRKDGQRLNTANMGKPELIRFASKIEIDEKTNCWLWRGYADRYGYGRFRFDRRQRSSHDFAFTVTRGSIPPGLELEHLCRVRPCCNPHHLECVSHAENMRRRYNFTPEYYKIHGLESPSVDLRESHNPNAPETRSTDSHASEFNHSAIHQRSLPDEN